jgi:hypothetical protein
MLGVRGAAKPLLALSFSVAARRFAARRNRNKSN